jgi:hypothetical protein
MFRSFEVSTFARARERREAEAEGRGGRVGNERKRRREGERGGN